MDEETEGGGGQIIGGDGGALAGLSLYLACLDYMLIDAIPALLSMAHHPDQLRSPILPQRRDQLGPTATS